MRLCSALSAANPVSLRRTWKGILDDVERDMPDAHSLTCNHRPTEDMLSLHVPSRPFAMIARFLLHGKIQQLSVIAVNEGYPSSSPV
jgi:hypothetical protein